MKYGLTKAPCFLEDGDFNETSPYGERIHPITGKKSFHYGVDGVRGNGELATITAIAPGNVIESTFNSARGNYVKIDHGNGVTTLYQHLANLGANSKVGTYVMKGSILGKMGSTGASTGAHLHLEVAVNGETQNSAPFIKGEKTIEQLVIENESKVNYVNISMPILQKGAKCEEVRTLQALLNAFNNAGLVVDGSFGPATDKALRDYQRSRGLAVDGSCGQATWNRILK